MIEFCRQKTESMRSSLARHPMHADHQRREHTDRYPRLPQHRDEITDGQTRITRKIVQIDEEDSVLCDQSGLSMPA